VKFPLTSYLAWFGSTSDTDRKAFAELFKRDVQRAIKQVHERGYIDDAAGTVDYAILFVPN
jgi:DNA anti-recombination protein RmuC